MQFAANKTRTCIKIYFLIILKTDKNVASLLKNCNSTKNKIKKYNKTKFSINVCLIFGPTNRILSIRNTWRKIKCKCNNFGDYFIKKKPQKLIQFL